MKNIALLLICLSAVVSACTAQTLTLERIATPAAGGSAHAQDVEMQGTAGQSLAGFASTVGALHWIGFWVPLTVGQEPMLLDGIAQAKLRQDGDSVAVAGVVATSSPLEPGGFFYISSRDRASGIRVQPLDAAAISPGLGLSVSGIMDSLDTGERQIAGAMVSVEASGPPLLALGTSLGSVGGEDFGSPPGGQLGPDGRVGLNNVGLLLRTWGTVVGSQPGFLLLDDGLGSPVLVDIHNAPGVHRDGDRLAVTGISSLVENGGVRLPRLISRSGADIAPLD